MKTPQESHEERICSRTPNIHQENIWPRNYKNKKQELLKKKTFILFSSVFLSLQTLTLEGEEEGGGRRVKEQTTSLFPTAGCRALCYAQAGKRKKCWTGWEMKVWFLNLACCGPGMLGSKAGQKCEGSGDYQQETWGCFGGVSNQSVLKSGFLGGEALPVPSKLSSKMKSLAVLGKEYFNSDSVKKVNCPGHNLKTSVPWWSWVQVFPFSMIHSLISHNHFSCTCQDPNYKVRMDSSTKHHKYLDPQKTLPMDKHLMGGAGFCFYFKVQKVSCTLFRGKSGLCVL